MTNKTTVAVDPQLRKKIKRLAAQYDLSQGEIIELAILSFEKHAADLADPPNFLDSELLRTRTELAKYTERVWEEDSEVKRIQQLMSTPIEEGNQKLHLEDVILKMDNGA